MSKSLRRAAGRGASLLRPDIHLGRHELGLGSKTALILVGPMHLDQPFEFVPRKMLQHAVKHGILMPHGIVPLRVLERPQRPNTNRYSAVRAVKHKMCRTAVWSSPAMTIYEGVNV